MSGDNEERRVRRIQSRYYHVPNGTHVGDAGWALLAAAVVRQALEDGESVDKTLLYLIDNLV